MPSRFSSSKNQSDRHEEEVRNIVAQLSVADCYDALRTWYRGNIDAALLEAGQHSSSEYMDRSAKLIRALPPSSSMSDLEIRRVVDEVIQNKLEWGYWREDSQAYMISYARAILANLNVEWGQYSEAEKQRLQFSRLWPYFNDSMA